MLLNERDGHIIFKGIRPLKKLGATARELALATPFANMGFNQRIPDCLQNVPPDPWPGDAQRGRDLISGVFRFAGQGIERENLSWNPQYARPEWVEALHGFEWLRDLRSVGGDRARRMAREMVAGWIDHCRKPDAETWSADITGLRLASWISFYDFFCASADDDFRQQYFLSLTRQARYLARALPGKLAGIPLMKALKGLAWTGIALEDGRERLEQAFRLVLREIRIQILPDGAHISRSPQATFEFLQCLVDLRAALIAARIDLPDGVQHAIDRITPTVKFFRHADGGLAHFNGSQEGNAHICERTLMHSGARGKAMRSLPHCGYEGLQQGRASVVMDTGLPLSSAHSARAHAGLLAFEYSYGRDRVIVNCGTADVPGRWRDLLRSTAAHTTLTIDRRDACVFDANGRMENRPDITVQKQEQGGVELIAASHNGYVPRFGLKHSRIVCLKDNGEVLAGEDIISGNKEGVPFAARFHLHPGIQASLIKDGTEVLLRARSGTGWRFRAEGAALAVEDSIYASEGEHPRRALQISLQGVTVEGNTTVTWELRREKM